MRVTVHTVGEVEPRAGERTWLLTVLPVGAVVRSARLAVRPFGPPSVVVTFADDGTVTPPGPTLQTGKVGENAWAVVDFHGRREVDGVAGTGGPGAVQIALGGAWVPLAANGGPLLPGGVAMTAPLASATDVVNLPVLACERLMFTRTGEPVKVTKVRVRAVPSNLTAQLGDQPPFWSRPGEVPTEVATRDFAAALNAHLARATPVSGRYEVPITVRSDTACRLQSTVEIEYGVRVAPVGRFRFTAGPFPAAAATLAEAARAGLEVAVPAGAGVLSAALSAEGRFERERAVDPPLPPGHRADAPDPPPLVVSLGRSVALPVRVNRADGPLVGCDLRAAAAGATALTVRLETDRAGKPSGEAAAEATVAVGSGGWLSVRFPTPVPVAAGRTDYWLTCATRGGAVAVLPWKTPGDPRDAQVSTDDGFSWRRLEVTSVAGTNPWTFRPVHAGPTPVGAVICQLPIGGPFPAVALTTGESSPDVRATADLGPAVRGLFAPPRRLRVPVVGAANLRLSGRYQFVGGAIPFDHAELQWYQAGSAIDPLPDAIPARQLNAGFVSELKPPDGADELGVRLRVRPLPKPPDDPGDDDPARIERAAVALMPDFTATPTPEEATIFRIPAVESLAPGRVYALRLGFKARSPEDPTAVVESFEVRWSSAAGEPAFEEKDWLRQPELFPRLRLPVPADRYARAEWVGVPPAGAVAAWLVLNKAQRAALEYLDAALLPVTATVAYRVVLVAGGPGELTASAVVIHDDEPAAGGLSVRGFGGYVPPLPV